MNSLYLSVAAAGLLGLAGGVAAAPVQQATASHQVVVVTDVDGRRDDQARSIQMTIVDGEISVTVDGEPIPESRLKRDDGRVVILDASGQEIESIHVGPHPGGEGHFGFVMGDDADNIFWHADQNVAIEPLPVMLGIHLDHPGPALERHLGLEPSHTTMISGLYEGLAAQRAGVEEFDIIVAIDGKTPSDPMSLRAVLAEKKPGQVVQLSVIQRGKRKTMSVTLDAFDPEAMAQHNLIGRPARVGQREMLLLPDRILQDGVGGIFELQLPGGQRLLERMPDLNDIFVDDDNQLFERSIRIRPMAPKDGSMGDVTTDEDEVEALEERMRRLERLLREVLEDTP